MSLRAFNWGRKYYTDAAFVESQAMPPVAHPERTRKPGVSRPVFARAEELAHYQNKSYAQTYLDFLATIPNPDLRDTVARYLYKLMAYKDEYEVARLLTKPSYEAGIKAMWESPESIRYNLHPPLLRRFGMNRKLNLGPWFRYPLRLLSHMKFLRGTPFDLFGYASHRRKERELITWYRGLVEKVSARLTPDNLDVALEIASLPDQIRGYEKIKEASIDKVKKAAEEKLQMMQSAVTQVSLTP